MAGSYCMGETRNLLTPFGGEGIRTSGPPLRHVMSTPPARGDRSACPSFPPGGDVTVAFCHRAATRRDTPGMRRLWYRVRRNLQPQEPPPFTFSCSACNFSCSACHSHGAGCPLGSGAPPMPALALGPAAFRPLRYSLDAQLVIFGLSISRAPLQASTSSSWAVPGSFEAQDGSSFHEPGADLHLCPAPATAR